MNKWMRRIRRPGLIAGFVAIAFIAKTGIDFESPPDHLMPEPESIRAAQYLDRSGEPLNVTLQNQWNFHDTKSLYNIPPLLVSAFLTAEDKRFFEHSGADWRARISAISQNLQAGRIVRGASTISEQVVRLLHPRPRTFWSRWLEGWEAYALEQRFSKAEILEFYLNQVPYARQRRGVVQASNYYFNRELRTLNNKELLALAVLVRAPSRLDPINNRQKIEKPIAHLANALGNRGLLSEKEVKQIATQTLELSQPVLAADAAHFVVHLKSRKKLISSPAGKIVTTLDASLQRRVRSILENRIRSLRKYDVSDGGVLVVDHIANEILVWANAGGFNSKKEGSQIDVITMLRQPGSTLKPFLYALAMEKGWTAATLIDDSPMTIAVGNGLHSIRNYSNSFYGPIRLREALGNSLNVPAIRTVGFVGRDKLLSRLRKLGFKSLSQHPDFYGDGLGLGNGEVSLFELVRAYSVLARNGQYSPLKFAYNQSQIGSHREPMFSSGIASLISDILADPDARSREFGRGSVLRFPVQTAVKTGTSTDYRDAWAVGYSHRYSVGVWMGNLDQRPMKEITGSIGPGMVLRAVFSELNRVSSSRPLIKNLQLRSIEICPISGLLASDDGPVVTEWFRPGFEPRQQCSGIHGETSLQASIAIKKLGIKVAQPLDGMQMAMDPRIPDNLELLPLKIDSNVRLSRVQWVLDGNIIGSSSASKPLLWPLERGAHTVYAKAWLQNMSGPPAMTQTVRFIVK